MKNVLFKVTRFQPSMAKCSLLSPSCRYVSLGLYCPAAPFALLRLHFLQPLFLQQTRTHTPWNVIPSLHLPTHSLSDGHILAKNITAFSPLILRRFIPFFSLRALFTSNECHNLKGEMISSRAFSCWIKHESFSLRFQHGCSLWDFVSNKTDFALKANY